VVPFMSIFGTLEVHMSLPLFGTFIPLGRQPPERSLRWRPQLQAPGCALEPCSIHG
jgi:hypothetical protein